jgi:hypothetical protein
VKVSKDGFNSKSEDSSFEVTGSGNNNDDDTHDDDGHDNDKGGKDDSNNGAHDGDGGGSNGGKSNNQALSQGNACGNGVLSTNIFCQNIANQLQGDGNAINIIALQNGGGEDEVEAENSLSGPSIQSFNSTLLSSVAPTPQGIQQLQAPISGSRNVDSIESIIEQYEQARLNHAIETRLNHLK